MLEIISCKTILLILAIFQNTLPQVLCEPTSFTFKGIQSLDFEQDDIFRFGDSMHNDKYESKDIDIVKVEGSYILNSIVSSLSELLVSRRKIVSNLAKTAKNFSQKGSTENDANKSPESVAYSYNFKKEVNFNTSYVQVPYSVLPQNLKNLSWSKNFEKEFKKNYERDKSLKWQYFGSTEGYTRIYPSFQWTKVWVKDDDAPNMYDCRKEIWYTRAVACPHRNVILLDNSGSMKGMNKALAISVVSSILQVLTDSDFFTILAVSFS